MAQKRTHLLKCTVIHSLSGRIRINCRALRYLKSVNSQIQDKLLKMHYIKTISINNITCNVLITYDDSFISAQDILIVFEELLSEYSLIAYKDDRKFESKNIQVKEEEEDIKDIKNRILLNCAVIGYGMLCKRGSIRLSSNALVSSNNIFSKFTTIPALSSIYFTKSLFKNGICSALKRKRLNADTLTITSIASSIMIGKDTSALMIILLSDIAEYMTSYTMKKTRDSIKHMMDLNEQFVWKVDDAGSIKRVLIEDVKLSDVVIVHTGEKICVDGSVISGEAIVDQSSVTGEFMPDIKRKGSAVFAGTIVKNGTIKIKTEKAGDDTVVSRIINMVENASHNKAKIQNYADHFSNYLVPFNFVLAGAVYMATKNPTRALNMMIIDYSCGIKLSTATAFSASINTAVRGGVLIKGGNYIESLSKADTLILDKTGTLTQGRPEIVDIIPAKGIKEEEILKFAASAEETSSHPMSVAIMSRVKIEGIKIPKHTAVKTFVSRGVQTSVGKSVIRVGNKAFLDENNVAISLYDKAQMLVNKGQSVIYVAKDDKCIGIIGIQDKMRENMKKSLNNLRYQGIDEIMLLTGDTSQQAEIVANKMGVDSYQSELLPEDKAKMVLHLQGNESNVIMVGDGINDAPALAYADVGISLGGKSTDVAMETADITIQSDDPMAIATIMSLSKKTMNIVKQNFGLVIGINTMGLVLSASGSLPVFWGAVLHNSSTIFVVSNSLRLLFFDMKKIR